MSLEDRLGNRVVGTYPQALVLHPHVYQDCLDFLGLPADHLLTTADIMDIVATEFAQLEEKRAAQAE